ncbi:MAG: hypothetical protein AAFZ63_14335 [Bacteroidota bacterium]
MLNFISTKSSSDGHLVEFNFSTTVVLTVIFYLVAVNKLVVTIAVCGILAQVLSIPFVAFKLISQRDTVALANCINFDQPQLHCAGSCYISQQLAVEFEQDRNQGTSTEANPGISLPPFSTPPETTWQLIPLGTENLTSCFRISSWKLRAYTASIWQPPRV